jgi:hypothetical protein
MRCLDPRETAVCLGLKISTVRDARFRARVGLVATRIGRALRFHEADVKRVVRRGREMARRTDARVSVGS